VRRAFGRSVVVAAFFLSSSVSADYVVNRIDYVDPDTGAVAPSAQLWSINRSAQALGTASFDPAVTAFNFVYNPASGNYERIPLPAGFDNLTNFATVIGINDAGVMTGSTFDSNTFLYGGFILRGGVYEFFSHPQWAEILPRTIGNPTPAHPQGLVVGQADDAVFEGPDSTSGFIYDPASRTFAPINGINSFFTFAHGQNASGMIVGNIESDGTDRDVGAWAFVFTPSTPGDPMLGGSTSFFRVDGVKKTYARGINDKNVIALFTRERGTSAPRTYVGTPGNFQLIEAPGTTGPRCPDFTVPGMFAEHLTNAGQVIGQLIDDSCVSHGFIATPASLPTGSKPNGASTFSVDVAAGEPTFISLPVAPAFDYKTGKGNPRIAAVRLPLGIGNNKFVLVAGERAFAVNAGQLFDFRAQGFNKGVKAFRVACVDAAPSADPAYVAPFPTELTFVADGRFTGSQRPLAVPADMTPAQCRELLLAQRNPDGPDEDEADD